MRNNLAEKDGMVLDLAPKLKITVRMTVKEADGRISYDKEEPARSFNRNFWNTLFSAVANAGGDSANFGSGYMSGKIVGGTIYHGAGFCAPASGFLGLISNSAFGIVIGKTATAFNFEQYALAAQIIHGTGTDQMSHQAQAYPTISWTVGTLTWLAVHTRIFNNNSLASINVNETGLYSNAYVFAGGTQNIMIERNVLGGPVAVGVGAQLTVTYNISLVFPV
jgi:hypothetical protein